LAAQLLTVFILEQSSAGNISALKLLDSCFVQLKVCDHFIMEQNEVADTLSEPNFKRASLTLFQNYSVM
jgi:hypothetical protein